MEWRDFDWIYELYDWAAIGHEWGGILCAGDGGVWFVLKALRQVIRMLEDHGLQCDPTKGEDLQRNCR